jgi:hypothetical protein
MDVKDKYESKDKEDVTGSHNEEYKILNYPFGKYEIKIKLSKDNKFLDIIEIKINKDFLSFRQKMASKGVHDVEKFYRE